MRFILLLLITITLLDAKSREALLIGNSDYCVSLFQVLSHLLVF